MRAIVLTNPQSNQNALVSKLAASIELIAVVHSRNIPRKKYPIRKRCNSLLNSFAARSAGRELHRAWNEMLDRYRERYRPFESAPLIKVDNVNDETTLAAINELQPDLVIVSGTNIVGRKLIERAESSGGIVNLHTGISPYVKGGPNCTNWCLAKSWFHLIGNTVMWLDRGVDSGAIIATEHTPLDGSESLTELHWKVMEHAHDLYLDAIVRIAQGRPLPRLTQSSIANGTEFKSAEWTRAEMKNAIGNFKKGYRAFFENGGPDKRRESIKTFPLDRG